MIGGTTVGSAYSHVQYAMSALIFPISISDRRCIAKLGRIHGRDTDLAAAYVLVEVKERLRSADST